MSCLLKWITDIFESYCTKYQVLRSREWLTDCMAFNADFNSFSVMSRRQLTLYMSFLGFTSTRLWLWSVLAKETPPKIPGRVMCGSNLRPPGYESYILLLSHAGPIQPREKSLSIKLWEKKEKIHFTSIVFFSNNVWKLFLTFSSFQTYLSILATFTKSSAKCFEFGPAENVVVWYRAKPHFIRAINIMIYSSNQIYLHIVSRLYANTLLSTQN